MTAKTLQVKVKPISHKDFEAMGIFLPMYQRILEEGKVFEVERKKFHTKLQKWMYELRTEHPTGKVFHLWLYDDFVQEI